jgi:hypothetical protein
MKFLKKMKKIALLKKQQSPLDNNNLQEDPILIESPSVAVIKDPEIPRNPSSSSSTAEYQKHIPEGEETLEDQILSKIPKFLLPKVEEDKKRHVILGIAGLILMTILFVSHLISKISNHNYTGGAMENINFGFVTKKNVAFVGNLNFILNDLPRLTSTISNGKIRQNSCLHKKGNLLNILKTGNGMYGTWKTSNALFESSSGSYLYDYGACSVPQLLLGDDQDLSYRNQYGKFQDDGTNPCLNDQNYMTWEQNQNSTKYDFVVLTDQAKRMSFDYSRSQSLMALNYTFGPILKQASSTIPIVVQPHSWWSSSDNMTGLYDIPTFTSYTLIGAKTYKEALDNLLAKTTRIAPVGNAFLAVYEDNESLYSSLFLPGNVHPSPTGSLLYSLVIYATIYGQMPARSNVFRSDMESLFGDSRQMQYSNSSQLPTKAQAKRLYTIARRVTLKGYKPKSMP